MRGRWEEEEKEKSDDEGGRVNIILSVEKKQGRKMWENVWGVKRERQIERK